MSKFCNKCGAELSDNAKFCSKCGSKYEEVEQKKEENGSEKRTIEKAADKISAGITQAGMVVADSIDKGKEKFSEYQNLSEEEKNEKKQQYIDSAKEKSKEFAGDVKNFKTLTKKRKRKVIFTIGGVFALALVLLSIVGNKGLGSISAEEKIEIAKSIIIDYLPAEDLLSSGGVAHVMWTADENEVNAVRDGITFRFVINSDGSGYFDGAEKYGDEISEEALSAVWNQYYEIGQLSGTL